MKPLIDFIPHHLSLDFPSCPQHLIRKTKIIMSNDKHTFDIVPQNAFNVSADSAQVKASPDRYYDVGSCPL